MPQAFPQTLGPACPLQGGVVVIRLGQVRLNHFKGEPCFAVDRLPWLSLVRSGAAAGEWDLPAYRPGVCAAWRSALSSCSKHRQAPQLLTVPQPANPSRT